jgi:hypothetical protein
MARFSLDLGRQGSETPAISSTQWGRFKALNAQRAPSPGAAVRCVREERKKREEGRRGSG